MSLATTDIEFLRDLVARFSGNVIAPRHAYMLEQRLAPVAGNAGLENVESLVDRLRQSDDARLCSQVAEAVTVNETSFFRDRHLFEALRWKILPDLIARNSDRKVIRIWSAACSSGQEAYSIAMVIREHFAHLTDWKIQILASDLSQDMIRRSKSGSYSQLEISRGLPADKLARFFDRKGPVWQAKRELGDLIEHRRINLTKPWPALGQFDAVFVRNVLIYFDQETKVDLLRRARHEVQSEGYLFIGSAETLIGLNVPYQRKEIDATVCYRPTTV